MEYLEAARWQQQALLLLWLLQALRMLEVLFSSDLPLQLLLDLGGFLLRLVPVQLQKLLVLPEALGGAGGIARMCTQQGES